MKWYKTGLLLILLTGFLIAPSPADLTTIRPGGTVFLGEEGLDISASGVSSGGQIGWWAPGSMRSSDPTELVSVSSPTSFYVSPSMFSDKEGLWYTWPGAVPVFQVKKPSVSIRVYDETAGFDATGKWIPRGDAVSFRISSNVYEANSRGGSDGQVDISLVSPQGAKFSSVSGPSGSFSLEGVPLTSSLTSTGPVWSTGGVDSGTWIVKAELSMNRIKDNYPEIGGGVSAPVEVLIQSVNPLIKKDVAIEIGEKPAPDITTAPATTLPTSVQTPVVTPTVTPLVITPAPVQTEKEMPAPTAPPATTTPAGTKEPAEIFVTSEPVPAEPLPTQSSLSILPLIGMMVLILLVRRI